ncbi:MAG: acyl-CoA/acyl-ACP dehydrogenase [Burkholderiales bacterium]|nr:acyl-CoA/acyl-ACP dehydrogenase [Burkholderiales bacterium]
MSAVLAPRPAAAADPLAAIRDLVRRELAPKVIDIDTKAEYPEAFLRALGRAGGFAGAVSPGHGGNGRGLVHTIGVMEEVAKTCLSTGFLVWCQTAVARYIELSDNDAAKRAYLPRLATGELLGGTGLSNTMKSSDEIEAYRLTAERVAGGYVVNGVLPWVSNLGPGHVFVTGCPVAGEDGLAFLVVECAAPDFKLVECAHFVALDGTRTLACHFKDTFIPEARVLAHPGASAAYLRRIKPGMILAQMGMGLGLVDACAEMMRQSNRTHAHVNAFLDDQADDVESALAAARDATYALAAALDADPSADVVLDVLKLRLAGGELALRAANAALLHMGAKGYLLRSPAQRRLREAYFIAIVTPATKHLRKEIARLEARGAHPAGAAA